MKTKLTKFLKLAGLVTITALTLSDPAFAASTTIAPLEGVKKLVEAIMNYYKWFAAIIVGLMLYQLGSNSWLRGEIDKGEVVRFIITSALLLGFDTIVKLMVQFVKAG